MFHRITPWILCLLLGAFLWVLWHPPQAHLSLPAGQLGKISELAELVTRRVPVAQITATRIEGYAGGQSCILLVHGQVELGTDLQSARFENINPRTKSAVLILPQPALRRASLDHEKTSVYIIQREGLWQFVPSDQVTRTLLNLALAQAQLQVEEAGRDPQLEAQARRQAEHALSCLFEALGWQVTLVWLISQSRSRTLHRNHIPSVGSLIPKGNSCLSYTSSLL